VLLADAFVTGWHATELAVMQPGCKVAVFGAGTIGLLAAYGELLRGAAEVYVVDYIALKPGSRKLGSVPTAPDSAPPGGGTHGLGSPDTTWIVMRDHCRPRCCTKPRSH
jgi:glutathione-independent formaldehyde dehydrogenase